MNVLILGGAGEVGRHIVRAADSSPDITHIVIGERDMASAEALAATGSAKLTALALDITDEQALHAALASCDAVVSCVGPYYRFGTQVLSAAIVAGRHYIDVCDDWQPTLQMLELHNDAQQAGVCALVGMGASPGMSNLLAAKAHAALDQVDELHTIWGSGDLSNLRDDDEEDASSKAALEHWLLQATGAIAVWQEGQMNKVAPLQERILEFPGTGTISCHLVGHPEPVTLPRSFPKLRHSLNLMNMPQSIIGALWSTADELDTGTIDMQQAVERLERRLGEGEGIASLWGGLRVLSGIVWENAMGVPYAPEICALAIGEQDGQPARAGAWLDGHIPGGTGGMTGIPAAVVLQMLARGEITRHGVFAPEAAVDAERFFACLQPYAQRPAGSEEKPFVQVVVELASPPPS